MKYLCLAYCEEKKLDGLPKSEMEALVARCKLHDQELGACGHLTLVASLGPTRSSISIGPKGGRPWMTDVPFAETKEQIGAFFIIEASDLNDAIRVACKHPAAHLGEQVGWGIEVRPIEFFRQQEA